MKLVTARGVRDIPDVQGKVGHELADYEWSAFSDQYKIDSEGAFLKTMDELEAHIATVSVSLSREA